MDEFERTILNLAEGLEREKVKLERRIQGAQEQLDSVLRKWEGLQAALRVYREEQGIEEPANLEIDNALRERFRNMTQKDAFIEIARENHGVLVAKAACQTMVKAGVFRNERDAANSFYRTVGRFTDTFEKVRRGVYRLTENAPQSATG